MNYIIVYCVNRFGKQFVTNKQRRQTIEGIFFFLLHSNAEKLAYPFSRFIFCISKNHDEEITLYKLNYVLWVRLGEKSALRLPFFLIYTCPRISEYPPTPYIILFFLSFNHLKSSWNNISDPIEVDKKFTDAIYCDSCLEIF